MAKIYKTIFFVLLFSIAMAFLETAVVVYLRALYYPEGFDFPLKIISQTIATTEFMRELATMVMLIGMGIIAGRTNNERFAFFIFSFAIWDIFYYVFLKIILNWPPSLFTWDILFMVPLAWVGPVLAPVINSLTMILLALVIIYMVEKNGSVRVGTISWLLLIAGSLIVIFAYVQDYTLFMLKYMSFSELLNFANSDNVIKITSLYIPSYFNWYIFLIGVIFHLVAIGKILLNLKSKIVHLNNS
jgi:hypothetical protein